MIHSRLPSVPRGRHNATTMSYALFARSSSSRNHALANGLSSLRTRRIGGQNAHLARPAAFALLPLHIAARSTKPLPAPRAPEVTLRMPAVVASHPANLLIRRAV